MFSSMVFRLVRMETKSNRKVYVAVFVCASNRTKELTMFLGGLSSFKLKKTRPSTPWVDVNLLSHVSESSTKTPTNRMRDIDGLRLHVPILEERETLKIPQSSDRLILSDHMNVMMLCGGYAGVHFTAEVIHLFEHLLIPLLTGNDATHLFGFRI
jgi:hypothetical protein